MTVADGHAVGGGDAGDGALLEEVEGSVAVITPAVGRRALATLRGEGSTAASQVIDPMSTKGLEYDATVVVDPDEIIARVARRRPGALRRPDPRGPPDDGGPPRLSPGGSVTTAAVPVGHAASVTPRRSRGADEVAHPVLAHGEQQRGQPRAGVPADQQPVEQHEERAAGRP